MTSADLKPEQIARRRREIGRQLRYHNRLCARMQRLGWPLDDTVAREAARARNALQDLFTATHYAACKSGVGRPE